MLKEKKKDRCSQKRGFYYIINFSFSLIRESAAPKQMVTSLIPLTIFITAPFPANVIDFRSIPDDS